MNQLMRKFLCYSAVVEVCSPLRLDAGLEKERFITIPPLAEARYDGVLRDSDVKPATTGGTWYPSQWRPGDNRYVVLHFHGGNYVIAEGPPGDSGYAGKLLTEHLRSKAPLLSFRLASNPLGHFPAALQDTFTDYQYLLDQGITSQRIIVSGDSVGGHLAISLLRYLATDQSTVASPAAALLFSPSIDYAAACEPQHVKGNRNYATDYLRPKFHSWAAVALTQGTKDMSNPYFRQLHYPFRTKTPI